MSRLRCGLALVSGLALVAAACGGGDDRPDLDLGKAEREIRRLAEQAYSDEADVGGVRCPKRVAQEQGRVFGCTIAIDGEPLTISVRQKDDRGNVQITQVEAVIFTQKVEDFVGSYAAQSGSPTSAVSCGESSVITRTPGQLFSCIVEFADGSNGITRLQVQDTDGKVSLSRLR